jgi:hypothetical protein
MSGELTVIWWRGIPAQVTARRSRDAVRTELPARFQTAIDRAAMQAGLFGSDEYLNEWRRETRPCGDDLAGEVAREVERLEAAFDTEALARLVEGGGTEQERT